ncbi:hypothetical protein Q0E16_09835 [Mycolicibacterium frederiksbergense]|nr:hypothetical protein [Mycolicibacterium frederiksbergense]MDO0974375.1 hypothetical protein [Mycolicibacterium frederiksbergense]
MTAVTAVTVVAPVPLVVLLGVSCSVRRVVVVIAMFGMPISVEGRFGGVGMVCHVCP